MRILHTADWHLGRSLQGQSRAYEHREFLTWLTAMLGEHRVDALLIAGDVFDTFNPPAAAEKIWYEFLSETRERYPDLDVVVTSGNHDSAARLEAPASMLRKMNIHVVGRVSRGEDSVLDVSSFIVPLRDADGGVGALCVAVPFLRRRDLPAVPDAEDPLADGVRRVYERATQAAAAQADPGQALIAMGHLTVQGGEVTVDSERPIHIGGQESMSLAMFDEELDYVALGHLHKPQGFQEGGRIRYSGSPIPLSLGEIDYNHQVAIVDFEDGRLVDWSALEVPRTVDLMRIPADEGDLPLEDVLTECQKLPAESDLPEERYPFVDIHVHLPRPRAGLRVQIEQALEDRAARLARIEASYDVVEGEEGDELVELDHLAPYDVFARCHRDMRDEEPSPKLADAFRELLNEIEVGVES